MEVLQRRRGARTHSRLAEVLSPREVLRALFLANLHLPSASRAGTYARELASVFEGPEQLGGKGKKKTGVSGTRTRKAFTTDA